MDKTAGAGWKTSAFAEKPEGNSWKPQVSPKNVKEFFRNLRFCQKYLKEISKNLRFWKINRKDFF